MTRFAGRGRDDLQLDPVEITGGPRGSFGDAAGNVAIGDNYGALARRSPAYDQMAADSISDRASIINAITEGEAALVTGGLRAKGAIKAAEMRAEAAKEAADAESSANRSRSLIGGIGGIITAGIGLLSDESTKDGVETIDQAIEKLRNLRPVSFFYKPEFSNEPNRKHYGFIAQEFKEVMPHATYKDEKLGKLCIDTSELIAILVSANQELEKRVTALEVKNLSGVK